MRQVSKDKAPLVNVEIRAQWTDTSNIKAETQYTVNLQKQNNKQ